MIRRLCLFIALLLSVYGHSQDDKIGTVYGRFGVGTSQFWYQHRFQEIHTADSILYDYDNGGKKATHAGMSVNAEGGYCFARPFRIGLQFRARVYLENTTQLPGVFTWITVGPTGEYYFNEKIALMARLHWIMDTQFRGAENKSAWGTGLGIRYCPPEIDRCSISLSAEYAGARGDFTRYVINGETGTSFRVDQFINNRGFLLELALNYEL